MRRSSRWRILAEADLKPPRSVYGRNRHEADGATKAHDRCPLYVHALRFSHQGRCVMCADEKTAMPMLPRADPTQPVPPGKPEQRAHAYLRPGVRALLASCVVPPGHRVWHLGQTRTSRDGAAHLAHVVPPRPAMPRDAGVVDHRKTP